MIGYLGVLGVEDEVAYPYLVGEILYPTSWESKVALEVEDIGVGCAVVKGVAYIVYGAVVAYLDIFPFPGPVA